MALFEGEGVLCMGEVGGKWERHPGYCSLHCGGHSVGVFSVLFHVDSKLEDIKQLIISQCRF